MNDSTSANRDVRAPRQLRNIPRPGNEPISVDIDTDCGKHADLAIGAAQNVADRLPSIELTAIAGADGNQGAKKCGMDRDSRQAPRSAPQPKTP